MPKSITAPRNVVVTGDLAIDWNIACLDLDRTGGGAVWDAGDSVHAEPEAGGAAMLAGLISKVVRWLPPRVGAGVKVHFPPVAHDGLKPGDPAYHHSYALWAPHDFSTQEHKELKRVWRVRSFLGLDRMEEGADLSALKVADAPARADVIVLDDAALGFRESRANWPEALFAEEKPRWILVKMASPVAKGDLWDHLREHFADRLIAIVTADDLRKSEVFISRELSWEKTAQDLFWELTNSSSMALIRDCRHIVVSLGTAGAMLMSSRAGGEEEEARKGEDPKDNGKDTRPWMGYLLFDPRCSEGMWNEQYPGSMIGFTNCLAAGLFRQLLVDWDVQLEKPTDESAMLCRGIQSGVAGMRELQRLGYGLCRKPHGPNRVVKAWPRFPAKDVVDALAGVDESGGPLQPCQVEDPMSSPAPRIDLPSTETPSQPWSILDQRCSDSGLSLYRRAVMMVMEGKEKALDGVPVGCFGKLVTADRREIEAYRSICGTLTEYCRGEGKNPISIAVFGPPGSGKSFAVKQVAKSISSDVVDMVFNLSQFDSPSALIDALHQVRDVGLSGKTPLVFWDEFDSSPDGDEEAYPWLRYFLAPMQDGEFQSGQITHHVGRAIFVFAGGRHWTMEDFTEKAGTNTAAKGPDFVSRLKGYVNVLGPNPVDPKSPEADPHFLIRRATVLRGLLSRSAPQLFTRPKGEGHLRADAGVVSAFLQVSRYKHGIRSMESVIMMSTLWRKSSFERSCLPSEEQLDVHVSGGEFLFLAQQPDLASDARLEESAEAVHESYRESIKCRKDKRKYDVPYDELPEDMKEDNRNFVRDIPRKLAATGLCMVPARGDHAPVGFTQVNEEEMAEQEHMRWMKAKVAAGWKYGKPRDDAAKLHPDLRPWRKLSKDELNELPEDLRRAIKNTALPDSEKEIDRALCKQIYDIAKKLGYAIVVMPKPPE